MQNKILKSIVLSCILVGSVSTVASAEQTDPNVLALTSAHIAGSARYCKMEKDLIEEYITKVEAKLAYLSEDTYEKVLTKIEFKNQLDAASGKAPSGGCREFEKTFLTSLRALD